MGRRIMQEHATAVQPENAFRYLNRTDKQSIHSQKLRIAREHGNEEDSPPTSVAQDTFHGLHLPPPPLLLLLDQYLCVISFMLLHDQFLQISISLYFPFQIIICRLVIHYALCLLFLLLQRATQQQQSKRSFGMTKAPNTSLPLIMQSTPP